MHTYTAPELLRPICLEGISQCSIKKPSDKRVKWMPLWAMSSRIKCIGVYCTFTWRQMRATNPLKLELWFGPQWHEYKYMHNRGGLNSIVNYFLRVHPHVLTTVCVGVMCSPDCVLVCEPVRVSCCIQEPCVLIVNHMGPLQYWETRRRGERHWGCYRHYKYRQPK